MDSLEIVLGEHWKDDVRYLSELRPFRPADAELSLVEIRDIIDLVVDGRNLTACVDEESIFGLVAQLVESMVTLGEGRLQKAVIEFPSEPFELVVVPDGDTLLLSLYSISRERMVAAHDVAVRTRTFVNALSKAAESLLADLFRIDERFSTDAFVRAFSADLALLKRRKSWAFPKRPTHEHRGFEGSVSSRSGLTLTYDVADVSALAEYAGDNVFDLHALLVPGTLLAEDSGRCVALNLAYPVLGVQAILRRSRELLNLLEAGRKTFVCDSKLFQLRLDVEGGPRWQLGFGEAGGEATLQVMLPPSEALDTLLSLAEAILSDIASVNATLSVNQRFADLKQEAEDLRGWFEDLSETNKYLERPEEYLASHAGVAPVREALEDATFAWPFSSVRALYPTRTWTFRTPRIHFAAMALSSGRILVPTSTALIVIDSETGEEVWRATEKGGAPLSSYALAGDDVVLANERGELTLVRLRDGEDLVPLDREARGTLLLDAAHYPEAGLTVVADFHGKMTAFSPETGEIAWSYGAGHGYLTGVVFEGPILCTLSSPGFLQAMDPLDGSVLWKVRLGGVADSGPHAHHGRLYTFSHDPMTRQLTVHAFHPFTGRTAWQVRLEGWLAGTPDFLGDRLIIPLEKNGRVQLVAMPLEDYDPAPVWTIELTSAGLDRPTRCVAVEIDGDEYGVVRTDRAELTCFRLDNGQVRWRTRGEGEQSLLFRNLDLVVVRDSILTVGEHIEVRSTEDGSVLHTFGEVLEAPEYLQAMGNLTLLVGEPGTSEQGDHLTCLSLEHFLAVVEA